MHKTLLDSIPCNQLMKLTSLLAEKPEFDRDIRDQKVDKGDTLKLKIPFTGTGPFDFKLRKNNREIPANHPRIKLIPFDDYVIVQIKGIFL